MCKKISISFFVFVFLSLLIGVAAVYARDDSRSTRPFSEVVDEIVSASRMDTMMDIDNEELFNIPPRSIMLAMGISREMILRHERSRAYLSILESSLLICQESRNFVLPEHFGGIFIGDDRDLVIAVVDSYLRNSYYEAGINRLGEIDGITVRTVEFSHNQLLDTMNNISYRLSYLVDAGIITDFFFGLRPELNRVVVRLDDVTDENINFFHKHFFESPMIGFMCHMHDANYGPATLQLLPNEDEYRLAINPIYVNPGSFVAFDVTGGRFPGSVGYRVRRQSDGAVGFLTSPHCMVRNGAWARDPLSDIMGRVSGFAFGGSVDAVFVHTGYSPVDVVLFNTLPWSGHLSTIQPTVENRPRQFDMVAMVSNVSGRGETWGQVLEVYHRGVINGVELTNLTRTNITAVGGDSEGLVFNLSLVASGLVVGANPSRPHEMIFTKADLVHQVLGVERF